MPLELTLELVFDTFTQDIHVLSAGARDCLRRYNVEQSIPCMLMMDTCTMKQQFEYLLDPPDCDAGWNEQ